MKKIRLDPDSLQVMSFETESIPPEMRGTVRGAFRPGMTVGWENTECQQLSPTWENSCDCPATQGADCQTQVTCPSCLDVTCYFHGCTQAYTCDGSVTCAGVATACMGCE